MDLATLVAVFENRSKVFFHSEIRAYCSSVLIKSPPDPLWPLTQLKKNYNQGKDGLIYQNYTDQSFFQTYLDEYGASNRLIDLFTFPRWAHLIKNDNWFWKQKRAYRLMYWIKALPGVKRVYVCGSSTLEIANSESDLDLAILTYPGQLFLARFWAKTTFKILGLDNHTLLNSFRQLLSRWKILDKDTVNRRIYEARQRNKSKNTDCGLFFLNDRQIVDYYGWREKQLSVLSKSLIIDDYKQVSLQKYDLNYLQYLPRNPARLFLRNCLRGVLYLLSMPLYPLTYLQLFWYKLKTTGEEDHCLNSDFSSFYQRWF